MNPLIARYLATGAGTEARERLLGTATFYGVGGYGYFYSLVSIILLLGFLFLNYQKKLLSTFIDFCFYHSINSGILYDSYCSYIYFSCLINYHALYK